MSTKSVTYCSVNKLSCSACASADVVLCLNTLSLVNDPLLGIPVQYAAVSLDGYSKINTGCGKYTYKYTFTYDDSILIDPNVAITSNDIDGAFCVGCLASYLNERLRVLVQSSFCQQFVGIAALGTTQGAAAALNITNKNYFVHTGDGSNTGIILPSTAILLDNCEYTITNVLAGQAILVYPSSGEKIGNSAINAGISISAGASKKLFPLPVGTVCNWGVSA